MLRYSMLRNDTILRAQAMLCYDIPCTRKATILYTQEVLGYFMPLKCYRTPCKRNVAILQQCYDTSCFRKVTKLCANKRNDTILYANEILRYSMQKTPEKDILTVQGNWNAKVGKNAHADWGDVCGPYCNVETNEKGLRLLEFATFNNLVLTNTLGPHRPSRRWTWHSPHADYILERKHFRSEVNIHRARSFPGADIESGHGLVMMTFQGENA